MDFMKAVKAMKDGKKVRRKCWNINKWLELEHPCIINNEGEEISLHLLHIEATDWEVVYDDKDWNLYVNVNQNIKNYYCVKDIKKCRDLIIQDINKGNNKYITDSELMINIINKRFGDL